jgi:hypothetical protein
LNNAIPTAQFTSALRAIRQPARRSSFDPIIVDGDPVLPPATRLDTMRLVAEADRHRLVVEILDDLAPVGEQVQRHTVGGFEPSRERLEQRRAKGVEGGLR